MSKYIYNEFLSTYFGQEQKQEVKKLRPKLRKKSKTLVTKHYDTNAYTMQNKYGIYGRVINMYDYFQHTIDVPIKDLHVRLSGIFDLSKFKIVGLNPNKSDIYYQGKRIAQVDIAPLTVQIVGTVTWLNQIGDPISRDMYDRRGFKSCTQYFHLDGSLGHQIIYDINGKPVIEIIMMSIDKKPALTGFKLLDYDGADYLFSNEDELWQFFKSELESENEVIK